AEKNDQFDGDVHIRIPVCLIRFEDERHETKDFQYKLSIYFTLIFQSKNQLHYRYNLSILFPPAQV
ncbi:MAG: hypothetical protein AAFV78_03840, partial [Bacteroidota bacterium]